MSSIEERIRRGLDVETFVSADALLDLLPAGVRRRRRRRTAALVAGAAAAVIAVVTVTSLATSPGRTAQLPLPPVQTPKSDEAPSVSPSVTDWFVDVATDGSTLYATSHACPARVWNGHEPLAPAAGIRTPSAGKSGRCTPEDVTYWPYNEQGDPPERPLPVTVWRFAGAGWERLGSPGVDSSAQMLALPGGLVFVPWDAGANRRSGDETVTGTTGGSLRVSADRGETWVDWKLPWGAKRCSVQGHPGCAVGVAGEYVVAASGDRWFRRMLDSDDWEEISPPAPDVPIRDFDEFGYQLLALDDGTLVAEAKGIDPVGAGGYRVSRDVGSTWSALHDNPGQTEGSGAGSDLEFAAGPAVYAVCNEHVIGTLNSSRGCGYYRSTDLEHWKKVPTVQVTEPNTCAPLLGTTYRSTATLRFADAAVRLGGLVYEITLVPTVDGHEATRQELSNLDAPHRMRQVLEVSADECQTWQSMLG